MPAGEKNPAWQRRPQDPQHLRRTAWEPSQAQAERSLALEGQEDQMRAQGQEDTERKQAGVERDREPALCPLPPSPPGSEEI